MPSRTAQYGVNIGWIAVNQFSSAWSHQQGEPNVNSLR